MKKKAKEFYDLFISSLLLLIVIQLYLIKLFQKIEQIETKAILNKN